MASIVYKKRAYGGNTSIADANHVIANNGSGTNESLQNLLIKNLGNFTTIQSSTTASKAYSVGECFILNSCLYKVKTAIAAGGTINVGTDGNAVQTTVEAEIQTTVPEELNKILPAMVGEQIDNKFGDDIGDDVTSWLTEHVTPAGSAVVVDDTLTIEGAAADAKKTGDEISGLKEDFNDTEDVELLDNWQLGKYYKLNDSPTSIDINNPNTSTNYACIAVPCEPGDIFIYRGQGSNAARRYAWLSAANGDNNVVSISNAYSYTDRVMYSPQTPGVKYAIFNADKRADYHLYRIKSAHILIAGNDIDSDCLIEGNYYCLNATVRNSLYNVPNYIVGSFLLRTIYINKLSGASKIQILIAGSQLKERAYAIYRVYSSESFSEWFILRDNTIAFDVTQPTRMNQNVSLNDFVTPGAYFCNSAADSATMDDVPFFISSSFLLHVFNSRNDADTYKRQMMYANKYGTSSIYTRQKNALDFGKWQLLISSGMYESPMLLENSAFIPKPRAHGTVKKTLRIGTNNVAHYWLQGKDKTYLNTKPDVVTTWRTWLMKANCDILYLQECEDYIDQARQVSAFDYLYSPFFDSDTNVDEPGGTDTTTKYRRKILNKLGLDTNTEMITVPTLYPGDANPKDGYFNWCIVSISGIGNVLLIDVHNFAYAGEHHEEDRENYLATIQNFIVQKSPDYFILAGDFNIVSSVDKTNLLTFCTNVHATPANGGILGWFATAQIEELGRSYDNIIVSDNIRIESVECDPVLIPGGFLLTDHTPVTATVSFLDVSQ